MSNNSANGSFSFQQQSKRLEPDRICHCRQECGGKLCLFLVQCSAPIVAALFGALLELSAIELRPTFQILWNGDFDNNFCGLGSLNL